MTSLVRPDLALAASWVETVGEFHAAGEQHIHGAGLWDLDHLDVTEEGCRTVVAHLAAQERPASELPEGIVPCTYFWITDGPDVVGFLALQLSLGAAADLGIDRALVTCDEDNVGSRGTIERCGGVYEDTRNGKLRFWIDTR